jgi:hypothetical protein
LFRVLFVLITTPALFGLLGIHPGKPGGPPPPSHAD